MNACLEAMDAQECNGDGPHSPAFAPFDGCDTCIVREVLLVSWEEMWKQAKVEIGAGYGESSPE